MPVMNNLSSLDTDRFIKDQLSVWPLAADNFAALRNVETRELHVDGFPVRLQHNPARIVSTSAKTDSSSIKARKCFLCSENRPTVQQGIRWKAKYDILINPFPIFPRHLTIPDESHTPQLIGDRIEDMLELCLALPDYIVFYNGPACGASAPDHFHFQAGNKGFISLPDLLESVNKKKIKESLGASLYLIDEIPVKLFVIDAENIYDAQKMFVNLYNALPKSDSSQEPMINLLAYRRGTEFRILVIPRKAHRPSFYGSEGEGRMLISPASIDLAGVFIVPRRADYDKITPEIIRQIYSEVCLSKEEINTIAANVANS